MADPHLRPGGPLRDRRAGAQSHIRGYRSSCGPHLASSGAAAGGSPDIARAGLPVRMGNGAPPSPGLGPAISRDTGGPSRAGVAARRIVQSLRRGPSPDVPRSLIAQAAARLRHVLALAQRLLARGSPEPALPLGPERAVPCGRHCHSGPGVPFWYVRRRVAVWVALPRTFTTKWQCGRHCHSGPGVPFWYVRRRVAVWVALPRTFTTKWQCGRHCHSGPSVPFALPLGPGRTASVRSTSSGSVSRTATRP